MIGAIGALGGMLLGGLGIGANVTAANQERRRDDRNYKMQQQHYKYQKFQQQTTWDREDNAVQRRVNDMKLAGISPHAVAGGAAQASGPMGTKAPQREPGVDLRGGALITQALNASANVAQTLAQTQALHAQTKNMQVKNRIQAATASDSILSARLQNQYKGLQSNALESDIRVKNATEAARIEQSKITVDQALANFDLFNETKGPKIRQALAQASITEQELEVAAETARARITATKSQSRMTLKEETIMRATMSSVVGQAQAKELAAELANTDASKMSPRKKYVIDKVFTVLGWIFNPRGSGKDKKPFVVGGHKLR